MPDIIPHQQQLERLHKFHSLKGGQYWRAKNDIPEQCIEQDEVLLIESLRWVDNALHTVILRTHPSKYGKDFVFKFTDAAGRSCRTTKSFKEHRFLFNDFLDKFEFADDGQDIRSQELLAAQNRVSQLTQQMTETMSDPEALRTELLGRVEAKKASSSTPDLKSDNGEFIIDKLLGSSHLQVQSAIDVFEVILPKSLSEGPLPVIKSSGEIYRIHHWFGICPKGADPNVSLSNIEAPVSQVTRHSFDSREAAIMHILMQKDTVRKNISEDRFNTPEGVVERWY